MFYKASRKPRAGALGSLTECPQDIRPCRDRELIHASFQIPDFQIPDYCIQDSCKITITFY
jgi:hypothetical protein